MQENVFPPPPRRIGRTQQLFETAVKSGYDQIIKGDVIIKKLKKKHQYKITFSKVYGDRFFFYQVFNKDNTDSVNDQRFAAYIITKNMINEYNNYNSTSRFINKLVFTPTTIMELPNFSKYAFVINNMYFNSHKCLVYIVSTKEINLQNNISKKLTQIPCGKFKHVRFDVDAVDINSFYFKQINEIWNLITTDCITYPNDKQFYNGYDIRICDIPMPAAPPAVCNGVSFLKQGESRLGCLNELQDMVNNNLLPEVFTYILSFALKGSCSNKGNPPPPVLYFSYNNSVPMKDGEVIDINIPVDNFSIDLSKYVVGNNGEKQIYEIEVLDDRMEVGVDVSIINGSTLFILLKKQTSLTLTVRQKYFINLEIKATLNIIPS